MRKQMRTLLHRPAPARRIIVSGSLAKPGRFSEPSDGDLALDAEPAGFSIHHLRSILAGSLARAVEVVLLPEWRDLDKVLREGQSWMLLA